MKEKKQRIIVAFYTTHDAMGFEEYCHEKGISGRLIPLPGEISAGCGLAWSSSPEDGETVRRALSGAGIRAQEIRTLMVF